jgi:hypothetical protein
LPRGSPPGAREWRRTASSRRRRVRDAVRIDLAITRAETHPLEAGRIGNGLPPFHHRNASVERRASLVCRECGLNLRRQAIVEIVGAKGDPNQI